MPAPPLRPTNHLRRARGSSVRRHNPYTFTMNFTTASKVFLGTPLRMKGVQIGRVRRGGSNRAGPGRTRWPSTLCLLVRGPTRSMSAGKPGVQEGFESSMGM
jgi:hypothetical protein